MLARGKTPTDVVGCDGCCCYCDLYNLAEYAYRDRISYPPAGLQYHTRPPTPTPYSNMVGPGGAPIHTHVMEPDHVEVEDEELKDELKSFQHHTLQSGMNPRMIPTDVAVAFLLSLDLLRNIPPQQQGVPMRNTLESRDALYQALESYLLKHECHRRSSSYGTLGNKVDDGEGGFTGYKEGETPTTEYQIPNYEMDPNMRAPGGSLGRVENALKYRDFPTLTTVITPTNSLSSSVTPTLPPSSSLAPTHPAPSSLTSTHPLSSLHRPTHPALSSLTTSHPSSYTPTTHPPLPSISLLSYQTPIPTPIFTPIPCSSPSSAPIATSSSMPWLRPPYPFVRSKSDGRGHIGEGGGGGGGGLCTEGGVADDKELGAYWELLDSELRPIEPVLSCPESLSIFSEHKEMAKKYLILQQEIFNLQHKKGVLEEKLSQAEKLEHLGNQRYQDKIRELENKRENLRRTRSKLRQQLEQICLRQEEQQQRQNHQEDVTGDGISHNHPLSPP